MRKLNIMTLRQRLKMFYDVMHFTFQVFAVEIFLSKGRLFENLLIKEIKSKYHLPYLKSFHILLL